MDAPVHYRVTDPVGVITLNRPEARNAVNGSMAVALEGALDRLENDRSILAAVLEANVGTQATPVFSAGADIKELAAGEAERQHTARGGFGGLVNRDRNKPIIAAVDGLAVGGGCLLAMSCDMVVASQRSTFGFAEVRRGLMTSVTAIARLTRTVGRVAAMETILTGFPLSADRAHELGLVNHVVAPYEVTATAIELARRVGAAAPIAVQESRRLIERMSRGDDAFDDMGRRALDRVLASRDSREGMSAFVDKRSPRWEGW